MEGKKETAAEVLRRVGSEERSKLLSKNEYPSEERGYNASHPNAKSDGDDKGMGENNGSVGTKTDIKKRNELVATNIFSANKPYTGPEE